MGCTPALAGGCMSKINQKPNHRQSGIKRFQDCGLCYEAEYLLGMVLPPTGKMAVGTAVDDILSFALTEKMNSRVITEADAVVLVKERMAKLKDSTEWEEKEPFADMLYHAEESMKVAMREIHAKVDPIAIQLPFIISSPELPFNIVGTIDLIDKNGNVRDTKVSGKKNDLHYQIQKALQPAVYSYAYKMIFDKEPNCFIYDRIIRPQKTIGARYEPISGRVTDRDYNHFFQCAIVADQMIHAKLFMPAHEASHLCNCDRREKFFGQKGTSTWAGTTG